MNFKKILITLTFVISLFSISAYAKTMQFTMGDYDAKVDDGTISTYTMEVAPYTVEGRTMVPVRIVGETFDADVQYVHEESKVVVTLDDKTITLIIGEKTADVNGEVVELDVPSVETNGRTLVPLRFVSENLGFDVKYVAATEQVLITNDPAVIEINGAKISLADFRAVYDMYTIEYGEAYSEDEIFEVSKLMLMNYAVSEAEADKWHIPFAYSYAEEVRAIVADLNTYFPGSLDGVWANLIEIEYRATDLANFLSQIYMPDEETVGKYYTDNYFAAKHILVSDEATAKSIMVKLNNGADFDELMIEYTEDPGVETNPDGYVFTTGEMVEEFENATKSLAVGRMSGIVETDYGYHIIKRIPLPAYTEYGYDYVADAYVNEAVANHFTDVIENGEVKSDVYTDAQLLELCK